MTVDQQERKAILKAIQKNIKEPMPDEEREELIKVFNKILKAKKGEIIEIY